LTHPRTNRLFGPGHQCTKHDATCYCLAKGCWFILCYICGRHPVYPRVQPHRIVNYSQLCATQANVCFTLVSGQSKTINEAVAIDTHPILFTLFSATYIRLTVKLLDHVNQAGPVLFSFHRVNKDSNKIRTTVLHNFCLSIGLSYMYRNITPYKHEIFCSSHQLTPRSTVLLDKLIVSQLVKNSCCF
jgi:hypothetical protein